MHVFGLTGGIGSGKSAVAREFARLGIPVVDADEIAREVVSPGSDGLRELVKAFGDILCPDGSLDRKALARVAFASEDSRRRLGAITHPRIAARSAERFQQLAAAPLVCYEAALLVENGIADGFRPLIVVDVPEALQHARTLARDGGTHEDLEARLRAQLPREAKRAAADILIDNSGSLDDLKLRAREALRDVCVRCQVDPAPYLKKA